MTPGKKTSEFLAAMMPWVMIALTYLLVAMDKATVDDIFNIIAALGVAGAVSSYGYSKARATVKAGQIGGVIPSDTVQLEDSNA